MLLKQKKKKEFVSEYNDTPLFLQKEKRNI